MKAHDSLNLQTTALSVLTARAAGLSLALSGRAIVPLSGSCQVRKLVEPLPALNGVRSAS